MTILASKIVADAAVVLQDTTHIRWSQAELLGHLNMGRRAAAVIRPDLFVQNSVVLLAAGARQTLPANGHFLLRLNWNMGTDGATPGRAIMPASREHLDARLPSWRATTPTDDVESYSYDPSTPLQYLVFPPNTGAGRADITYGTVPADIAIGDPIGCPDVYQAPLTDYVLSRAFGKDIDAGGNAALATAYYQSFLAGLKGAAA